MKCDLLKVWIIGIIDNYGAVHSKIVEWDSDETHEKHYPNKCFHRWRWDFQNSLKVSILSSKFTDEEHDKVRRHLTRKYRITWWENGYHNIDDVVKKSKAYNESIKEN